MNIVGIIAEYNPFHNGHLYHINKIKENLKVDGVICLMSGNFVQRGEPAIFDKWARTKMALHGGVDLVCELPVCFSTSTAEIFAESSVKLLWDTKVVTTLSFGIENYNTEALLYIGKLLSQEPFAFKSILKTYLNKGMSFAAAREKAVIEYTEHDNINIDKNLISSLLKKPNSILAIEYIKAMHNLKADLSIYPVKRKGADYHDPNFKQYYSSATAIRKMIMEKGTENLKQISNNIPGFALNILDHEAKVGRGPINLKDFEKTILYVLRCIPTEAITQYFDVGEGLENRIKNAAKTSKTLETLLATIKTKRYPETKIQRIIIHILLNIKRDIIASRAPLYIRVLGMNSTGASILREIKKRSALPILTRASHYKSLSPEARNMFELDLLATDIYCLANKNLEYRKGAMDFNRRLIYFNSLK